MGGWRIFLLKKKKSKGKEKGEKKEARKMENGKWTVLEGGEKESGEITLREKEKEKAL